MDKINIVILTGSNPYKNSGIVALDMFKSLKEYGHSVQMITKFYDNRFEIGITSVYSKQESSILIFKNKVQNRLSIIKKEFSYYMHSINEFKRSSISKRIVKKINGHVDLFIYLFPHGFLNFKDLNILSLQYNAFVFLMPVDMALFTGGCHYSNNCTRYIDACGKCPGLNSNNENDRTKSNIDFKKRYLIKEKFFTLSNTWLSNHLKKSYLFSDIKDFYVNILVNDKIFMPAEPSVLLKKYNISPESKILFFGAAYLNEERKGLKYLLQSIKLLYGELSESERKQIVIVVAGQLNEEITNSINFKLLHYGHLSHTELAEMFQMANVFVSPSIQDAGPMMVIQSMMCGTPVVAFEMGNATDFIEEGITGYSVPLYNVSLLKEKIKMIIQMDGEKYKIMRENCRQKALKESSFESFVTNIHNFYNEICNEL